MPTADSLSDEHEEQQGQREMPTAVRDQNLVIDGWMASHADSGTPGPHVRLWAPGANGVVLRTDQIPELIAGLEAVAQGIEAGAILERVADFIRRAETQSGIKFEDFFFRP